jgi:hypothetical protein
MLVAPVVLLCNRRHWKETNSPDPKPNINDAIVKAVDTSLATTLHTIPVTTDANSGNDVAMVMRSALHPSTNSSRYRWSGFFREKT